MKKLISILSILLCLLIVSCSGDGKNPADAEKEENQKLTDSTFSLDTRNIKSIATSTVDMKIDSIHHESRRITNNEIENQTMLVYYDKNDQLAPLVFKNKDGRYVMFPVEQSFPLSEDIFAIEFGEMYVSNTPPEFMENSSRATSSKIPVIENLVNFKTYRVRGQLLVSTASGKAAFLNNIDFSKFKGGYDGEYWYDGNNDDNYNLYAAYVSNGYVYIPRYNRRNGDLGGIYKISISNPTIAEPIVNASFMKANGIQGGNDRVLIVSDDYSNIHLVDVNAKISPRKVDATSTSNRIINGHRYHTYNTIGSFNTEILLGNDYWNIQTVPGMDIFLYDSNGDPLSLPYDFRKGFKIGNKVYEPSDNYTYDLDFVEVNGSHYPFITTTTGYILHTYQNWCSAILDSNGETISTLDAYLSSYLEINGVSQIPSAYDDHTIVHNGKTYTYSADADGYYYATDENGKTYPIYRDGAYRLRTTRATIEEFIKLDYMEYANNVYDEVLDTYITADGNALVVSYDEQNGYYMARMAEPVYDLEGNPIKNLKWYTINGLYDYFHNKIDAEYENMRAITVNGNYCWLEKENGMLYFRDETYKLLATEIIINEDLSTDFGRQAMLDLPIESNNNWWDWDCFQLLNVLPSEQEGVYNLYYKKNVNKSEEYSFHMFQLDTNGKATLNNKFEKPLGKIALPNYQYSSIKNWYCNSGEDRSMVWGDNGHSFYWVDANTGLLSSLNLDTGELDSIKVGAVAGNALSRVQDNLIFSTYRPGSAVDVETYALDRHDLHGEKTLISTNLMSMVPLVELDATNL